MDRAQVIKVLKALKEAFEEERDAYPICLEEAIRLLEQPDGGDMISRKEAIDAIEILLEQSEDDEHDKTWNNAIRGAINSIKHHVPSAWSEVIACGDCKHWICHDRRCGYWNHGVRAIDWCSHAERRTDE